MNKSILDLYTDFLICSTSQTSATALSRATNGAISHDKVTRFLSEEDFTPADLWQFAKPLIKSIQDEKEAVRLISRLFWLMFGFRQQKICTT